MSDVEDDFMCEDEDYDLVCFSPWSHIWYMALKLLIQLYRSILKTAILNLMSIWRTSITIQKPWKKTNQKQLLRHSKKSWILKYKVGKKENGVSKLWNRW